MHGSQPGEGLVKAEAEGFAPTARVLTLETNLPPIQLSLGAGRVLRVRVVDTANTPIAGASVGPDSFPRDERSVPLQVGVRAV